LPATVRYNGRNKTRPQRRRDRIEWRELGGEAADRNPKRKRGNQQRRWDEVAAIRDRMPGQQKRFESMSNQVRRPPLRGMIIQGNRIVGGLDLPEPTGPFVEHFNREYGSLGLRVEVCSPSPGSAEPQGQRQPAESVAAAP
jgi:hypothetical protein